MVYKDLVIINNEKILKEKDGFYCNNIDIRSIPEGLSKYNEVYYIARSFKKKASHKLNLKNIRTSSNIFGFIYSIFSTFKNSNSKYLLISINPYTFLSFLLLFLFKKNIFVYLRSSGHEEYKYILGSWAVWIYEFMYKIITSRSKVIVVDNRLHQGKKSYLVLPSKLEKLWFINHREAPLDQVKLLYVGRINPEKGIIQFFEIFNKLKMNIQLSIVSDAKNLNISNNNIKLLGHGFDTKSLISIYDDHNITLLPSFTEGHPHVVDESLARRRPVVIFQDILHIIKDKKGIFVSKRNVDSFSKVTKYIINNYSNIQKDIEKNKLPTRDDFLKNISNIIENN